MGRELPTDENPTASIWHVYTDFSSDIDLTDGSIGPRGFCARAVQALTAGNLVMKNLKGTIQTITGVFAGFQVAGACSTIESSGDGTTVTAVIVYW